MAAANFPGKIEADAEPVTNPSPIAYRDSRSTVTIGQAVNVVHNGTLTVINNPCKSKKSSTVRKPEKPLTKSSEKLSLDQKMALRDRLGKSWKDIGRYLGFDDGQLEQMEAMYPDVAERNYQLLIKWEQEKDESATRAALAKVLAKKVKRGDLADILADS